MKKRLLSVILCVVCISMLIMGCGSGSGNGDKGTDAESGADNSADAASDEVYNLTFTVHQSETTAFCKALNEWKEDVAEKSGGRLNIDIYYGGTLASATDAVEFVRQGGADMCWSTVSLNAANFKYCNILSMYGEALSNAQLTTYVYMNLCKNNQAFASEFENMGLKLLGAHGMTPSLIAGNGKKLETVGDFKGTSIMSISKACISVLDGFGAAVIGVTPADLYENFSKNVVQASLIDASLYVDNKLYEQFEWMNTYNYNSALAFIVMNQDKFNSLPQDLQDILTGEFENLSLNCAKKVDENFTNFVDTIIPENNIEVYGTSDEVISAINEQLGIFVEQPWQAACKEGGYDTEEIKSAIDTYISEGRDLYGEEYDWFD